jgi:hypothetical protein
MGMGHSKISVEGASFNRVDLQWLDSRQVGASWLSETNPPTLGGNK